MGSEMCIRDSYYFGAHRLDNKMIEHLKLQLALGLGLGSIVLFYHFFEKLIPSINCNDVSILNIVPYLLVVAVAVYLMDLKRRLVKKYNEFIANSPGKDINSDDISYGIGHGH